jgi:hypothetical protein
MEWFEGIDIVAPHVVAVPVTDNMQVFERAVSGDGPGVVAQKGR